MALVARLSPRARREHNKVTGALLAAAARITMTDKREARRLRAIRQGWQQDAWSYRDSIGELRYAVNFLAQSAARMRIYPAAFPLNARETDLPIPLAEAGAPPDVIEWAFDTMMDLGNDSLELRSIMESLSSNLTVAGECTLLGRLDPATNETDWTIRSVDEFVIYEDDFKLREVPSDPQGILGWVTLDPATTVASRIWRPHPRFRILADSALRAIMDDCESLLILRRGIRAAGRSRIAGAGVLLIPEGLSIKVPGMDDDDPEADPFFAGLAQVMMEPIADEGVASAVTPAVVRGPGEVLDQIRHLAFYAQYDPEAARVRDELVGIIATGIDLPKEIITGVADLNHWSAWQVDDNTFRHHIEPHVIECVRALTGAHLRPAAEADVAAVPELEEWGPRLVYWYDPTELVTHPDQTADAILLYDRDELSGTALRRISGFAETDKPTPNEVELRMISKTKNWPLNVIMALLHELDPTLDIPAIAGPPALPGMKPGVGVIAPPAPAGTTPSPAGTSPSPTTQGPPTSQPPAQVTPGPPSEAVTILRREAIERLGYDPWQPVALPAPPEVPALTAAAPSAGAQQMARLSRRLAAIDADLRTKVLTAANAAMLRQFERAGARLRTKVQRNETLRQKIAQRPNEQVSALLGPHLIAAMDVGPHDLIDPDWSDLRENFLTWTKAAQQSAIKLATQIAGTTSTEAADKAALSLAGSAEGAWEFFSKALTAMAHAMITTPNPDITPATAVPAGIVRAALGVAGGGKAPDFGIAPNGTPTIPLGSPIGQVATGATITDLVTQGDVASAGYEWQHGPTLHPFEPHEDLDGVEFTSFTDDALANPGDWPDNSYFFPGDHVGCLCDYVPLWMPAEQSEDANA